MGETTLSNTIELDYTFEQAKYYTKGRTLPIEGIILHSTEGTEPGDVATLSGKTGRQVSVHYYVTRASKIYHFVQESDTAWHAGAVSAPHYSNAATIGIEQEHIDGKQGWPDSQIQTVAELIRSIESRHGILPISAHAAVAIPRGRKTDPGTDYPWDTLHQKIADLNHTTVTLKQV